MRSALLSLVMLSISSFIAIAHEAKIGDLIIDHAIARETPPGSSVSAGYLKIINNGDKADKLIAVSTEVAETSEIHQMSIINDVMKMGELKDGLVIPAGKTVELKPSGLHIMFLGLKQALKVDDLIKVTLTFEQAGTLKTSFIVEKSPLTTKSSQFNL